MRKIIVSNMVTLDGYIAGPNGEIDWFVVNDEFFKYNNAVQSNVDTILFGRVTFQGMESYWTTPAAMETDPVMTDYMNKTPKVVFSKTQQKVDWSNSTLIKGNLAEEVTKLKQHPGKDIIIYGSGTIVSALTPLSLIDDYVLFITPVVLGCGKPLFEGINTPVNLKLTETKTFANGLVVLRYQPAAK